MSSRKRTKKMQDRIGQSRRRAMPAMWDKDKKVIAILCADIHLSLNPPIWRSVEPDWFEAMKRPLDEIRKIQEEYNCPIICAGDIFDKWNSSAELINFALKYLPDQIYAIPGQHDLPLHNYDDIKKSAYWTLVEAEKIQDISKDLRSIGSSQLTLYGFSYGKKITAISYQSKFLQIAIVHEYVWVPGKSYLNAPKENRLGRKAARYENGKWMGYDVVIYGDNHIGFIVENQQSTIFFNCGSLMRRKLDEIDYKPQIGLLLNTGKVEPYYLDTSKDKYLEIQDTTSTENSFDMKAFIQELEKLGDTDLDFYDAMKQYLKKNKVKEVICNIILKAMGL